MTATNKTTNHRITKVPYRQTRNRLAKPSSISIKDERIKGITASTDEGRTPASSSRVRLRLDSTDAESALVLTRFNRSPLAERTESINHT